MNSTQSSITLKEDSLSLLLVDDDRELCNMMKEFFAVFGHRVHCEHDGQRGLNAATAGTYDLVILDVMLPSFDGFTVLQHMRLRNHLPVVMLTARSHHRDRIQGLNAGADDYILKPFSPDELLARIRAVLRRTDLRAKNSANQAIGELQINFTTREVRVAEEVVKLTEMEFALLQILVQCKGRVVSRDELALALIERVSAPHERNLDVHVSHLRKKLGNSKEFIRTVRGVGYALASYD